MHVIISGQSMNLITLKIKTNEYKNNYFQIKYNIRTTYYCDEISKQNNKI